MELVSLFSSIASVPTPKVTSEVDVMIVATMTWHNMFLSFLCGACLRIDQWHMGAIDGTLARFQFTA
jgi:hypothetical protein